MEQASIGFVWTVSLGQAINIAVMLGGVVAFFTTTNMRLKSLETGQSAFMTEVKEFRAHLVEAAKKDQEVRDLTRRIGVLEGKINGMGWRNKT